MCGRNSRCWDSKGRVGLLNILRDIFAWFVDIFSSEMFETSLIHYVPYSFHGLEMSHNDSEDWTSQGIDLKTVERDPEQIGYPLNNRVRNSSKQPNKSIIIHHQSSEEKNCQ